MPLEHFKAMQYLNTSTMIPTLVVLNGTLVTNKVGLPDTVSVGEDRPTTS